jgi:8-oxo-dGTP pyrophosphatase MutT (NUDIX family)
MSDKKPPPWQAGAIRERVGNPYFSVVTQEVIAPDGSDRLYHIIQFPRPAIGIVVRRGSDFLLLHQYRFIVDEYVWAIPSGGVEEGETLEQAATRELREETGLVAGSIRPLMECYASYGCSNQQFVIYLAEDVTPAADGAAHDPNEVISWRWFTRHEVMQMVLDNGIVDNLSLSPILLTLLQDTLAVK